MSVLLGVQGVWAQQAVPPAAATGWFSIIWGDSKDGKEAVRYTLTEANGQTIELALDEETLRPQGGVLAFNRKYVAVQGSMAAAAQGQGAADVLNVTSITLLAAPQSGTKEAAPAVAPVVSGSLPWVSIMCKLSDYTDEPNNLAYFQAMYASTKPGLDHYWREVSYNTANVAGSTAAGWFTMPNPKSYYNPTDTRGGANLNLLAADCIAAADANVDFSLYAGINMMFNTDFDNGYAWGGGKYLTLDGVTKLWSTTWEPPWSYASITVMSHEMGHGFGLPHSSGAYGQTYDNVWDVMSDTWTNCSNSTDTTYGCLGQHTISYHKDLLGWIPAGQKYIVSGNEDSAVVTLDHLAMASTTNYRMVEIPIKGSSTNFYTVEVRQKSGYDVKLPGKAVIIHHVDTTRKRPAYVVDSDNNGTTGDAGAMWVVGETFSDGANGVLVKVLAETADGFSVQIVKTLPSSPVPVGSIFLLL
jgi:M6 family metalloprotease-like protein